MIPPQDLQFRARSLYINRQNELQYERDHERQIWKEKKASEFQTLLEKHLGVKIGILDVQFAHRQDPWVEVDGLVLMLNSSKKFYIGHKFAIRLYCPKCPKTLWSTGEFSTTEDLGRILISHEQSPYCLKHGRTMADGISWWRIMWNRVMQKFNL